MSETEHQEPTQSLREKIESWSARHAADFPPEIQKIFADKTEELLKSDILSKSIQEGEACPDFELETPEGGVFALRDQLAIGPVILSFYRGTWCPYCNLEFESLLETMPRFRRNRAMVIALSPQIRERRTDPAEAGFLDLCDRGNQVARQLGLVYPLDDQIKKIYQQFGIDLDYLNGEAGYEVPIPATYLIDGEFTVRYARANADITERAEPDELIDRLQMMAA